MDRFDWGGPGDVIFGIGRRVGSIVSFFGFSERSFRVGLFHGLPVVQVTSSHSFLGSDWLCVRDSKCLRKNSELAEFRGIAWS